MRHSQSLDCRHCSSEHGIFPILHKYNNLQGNGIARKGGKGAFILLVNEFAKLMARARVQIEGKVNYLAFVEDIIKALGLTQTTAEALTGKNGRKRYTASYQSWWNKNGNTFLANIDDFMDQLGYRLSCEIPYTKGYSRKTITKDDYNLEVLQYTDNDKKAIKETKEDPLLTRALKESKRLQFLAQFIKKAEGDIPHFLATMGIYKNRLETYFDNDDISIHFLYDVAAKYGSKLQWTIQPKTATDPEFKETAKALKRKKMQELLKGEKLPEVKKEAPSKLTIKGPADGKRLLCNLDD